MTVNLIFTSNVHNRYDTPVDWLEIERIIEKDFLA